MTMCVYGSSSLGLKSLKGAVKENWHLKVNIVGSIASVLYSPIAWIIVTVIDYQLLDWLNW